MAHSVDDKVLVTDQNSEYRNKRGVVKAVSGDSHEVRLSGHGCNSRVSLLTAQMRVITSTDPISYSNCSG